MWDRNPRVHRQQRLSPAREHAINTGIWARYARVHAWAMILKRVGFRQAWMGGRSQLTAHMQSHSFLDLAEANIVGNKHIRAL